MGVKKTSKATKSFIRKGLLKKKMDAGKKHRKLKDQAAVRRKHRHGPKKSKAPDEKNMFDAPSESESEEDVPSEGVPSDHKPQDAVSESGSEPRSESGSQSGASDYKDTRDTEDEDSVRTAEEEPQDKAPEDDEEVGYEDAFTFVRKLALLVRQAMKGKSSDASKTICNWEFLHAVEFWSKKLADQDKGKKELSPLIYPFVQTVLGACKVAVVPRYFPFRFHVLHSLLHFKNTYIPVAPLLFEALESPSVTKNSRNDANLKAFDITSYLHCPDGYKGSRAYSQFLVSESLYLLTAYAALEANSPAFPEYSVPLIAGLKKIAKAVHPGVAPKLRALADKLENNANWVDKRRKPSDFGKLTRIKDVAPLAQYADAQRKIREQMLQAQKAAGDLQAESDVEEGDDDGEALDDSADDDASLVSDEE